MASGEPFRSLFGENIFIVEKFLCVENSLYWKNVLIREKDFWEANFLVRGKTPQLWKRSRKMILTVKNFLRCGKYPCSRKISLTVENLLS